VEINFKQRIQNGREKKRRNMEKWLFQEKESSKEYARING